jgi:hypothetical protein
MYVREKGREGQPSLENKRNVHIATINETKEHPTPPSRAMMRAFLKENATDLFGFSQMKTQVHMPWFLKV